MSACHQASQEKAVPKGYLIANVRVDNPEAYAQYVATNNTLFGRYGGKPIVRGGTQDVVEGTMHPRTVVVEFPTLADARAFYDDPDYRENLKIRLANSEGNVMIVEGA